jgi:SAM-dependent methyltransferase
LDSEHNYQQTLVFPGALKLLTPQVGRTYLDIACGEGSFAEMLVKNGARAVGFDAAAALVERARRRGLASAEFLVGDARRFPDAVRSRRFDGAVCILAIQNISDMKAVFGAAAGVLEAGAPFIIVTNHPAFRIPRQSEWGWDETKKLSFRRLDRYLTPLDIPILMNPGGRGRPVTTTTHHRPIGAYVAALAEAGFVIDAMEEWVSDRESDSGARARAENRARAEFPLFLAIRARKK